MPARTAANMSRIGRLLRERGILQSPITMQAIVAWLRAHPEEGRALMRENK